MNDRKRRRPELDDDDEVDEAPVRKKKKKKKKKEPSRWPMLSLYIAGGVFGLLMLVLVIWLIVQFGGGGPPAQPVTNFTKFSTDEQEFGFEYPAGWGLNDYGMKGRREVHIRGVGGASIDIKENLAGSLVGDIAGAGNQGNQPPSDDRLPVSKVHEMRRPEGAKEEPAVTVETKFGKARQSAYTDGSKRGYRVTVLMHQTALDVFCECRASDWDVLRPAFDRFISSLGRGG